MRHITSRSKLQLLSFAYAHWKPGGNFFAQPSRSKLKEIGMLRLIPRMLALMAVQRHTATSRSTSPSRIAQQGVSGGLPTTAPTAPFSNLAHTPNFRVSLGQLFVAAEPALGIGFVIGLGVVIG